MGTFVINIQIQVLYIYIYVQHWMAPEIFESKPYSTKADVYSFGV